MLILEYFVTCFVKDEETTVTCFVKDEETTYIGRFFFCKLSKGVFEVIFFATKKETGLCHHFGHFLRIFLKTCDIM